MRSFHPAIKFAFVSSLLLPIGVAQAATFTSLYSFKGPPTDGFNVPAGVTVGAGGILYGTTAGGGASNLGTVYSLTPPASPGGVWTETELYSFPNLATGGAPQGGVAIGSNGVLYGTTSKGGARGFGTVFALRPPTAPGGFWVEKTLYSFKGGNDGASPFAGPVVGSHSVLYGTTSAGGPGGAGTVYSLSPPSGGTAWTEAVLYGFTGGADGGDPIAPVIIGTGGVLFGTTKEGGNLTCTTILPGCGTVFELTPPAAGGSWTETVLHTFNGGSDGIWPYGPVTLSGGILYGTTYENGTTGFGSVYSLTPPGVPGGLWTETVIYTFLTLVDGNLATGKLVIGSGGVIYGTTLAADGPNQGNVYSLTPPGTPGGAWTENVLYTFTGGADGANPYGGLTAGPSGVLYGTTEGGGIGATACQRTSGCGTVFEVVP